MIVASGALAALPGLAAFTACNSESAAAAARKLAQTVASTDSVRKLGERSLNATGKDSASVQLQKIFPGDAEIENKLKTSSPEQIRTRFAEQHVEDVEAGRVVEVDGWVLSNTEARLYALVALSK